MVRGERLIKHPDSWFSTKCIEVQPDRKGGQVELCFEEGVSKLTDLRQTANGPLDCVAWDGDR